MIENRIPPIFIVGPSLVCGWCGDSLIQEWLAAHCIQHSNNLNELENTYEQILVRRTDA